MTTPAELLPIARGLAREVGTLIRDGRATAEVAATKSSSVDIVTQMDVAAERLLRRRIGQLRPGDGIVGEEGEDLPSETGVTWVLDPIDGTVNYLYGVPHFGVCVAAVTGEPTPSRWTVQAGAICDATGTLWTAGRGMGAFRDGQRLATRHEGPALPETLLATGFQYLSERRARQGEVVAAMLPQVRDIRRLGAGALDLCHAASGMVDAYYEHGLKPWDIAAGLVIALESGLRVANLDGAAPDEGSLLAAPANVWEALRDALVEAGGTRMWSV